MIIEAGDKKYEVEKQWFSTREKVTFFVRNFGGSQGGKRIASVEFQFSEKGSLVKSESLLPIEILSYCIEQVSK